MLGSYNCQGSTAANFSHTKSTCRRHVPSGQPMPESRRRQLFAQRTCRRRVLGSSRCQGSTAASFSHPENLPTTHAFRTTDAQILPLSRFHPRHFFVHPENLQTMHAFKTSNVWIPSPPRFHRRREGLPVDMLCHHLEPLRPLLGAPLKSLSMPRSTCCAAMEAGLDDMFRQC
jgi:hypothetical protein